MKKVIFFCSLIIIVLISSCKEDNPIPPEDQPRVNFTLEDVSCTEVWLKLSTSNISLPADADLYKDSSLAATINLTTSDTILYIDSLLPNQSYSFRSIIQSTNQSINSGSLTVTTMDTTSHNFTWQSWTFGGQAGFCTFYDVTIINESNIWAVGEIYLLDSTGVPDPDAYNAIHWNGNNWEMKRIRFYGSCVGVDFPPLSAVWSFPDSEVVVTDGVGMGLFSGNTFTMNCGLLNILTGGINRIWGVSSNDYYVVGNNGFVAHFQNLYWNKIESGTSSIIHDIWGVTNKLDKLTLYCPVSSFFVPGDKKILKITDGNVDSVEWNRDVRLYSAWTTNDNFLYVCGEGAYVNKFGRWKRITIPEVGTNSIRGNNINDIFIAGDYGFKAHFNGVSWQVLSSNYNIGYAHVDFRGNIVAVCGNYNGKALIEIGRRN